MSADLTHFSVKRMPPMKVIGKELQVQMDPSAENPVPAFWGQCFMDGSVQRMEAHPDRLYPNALVGWMGDMNDAEQTWIYMVGILVRAGSNVPEGLVSRDLPETDYAVGTLFGTEPDIYLKAHDLVAEAMSKDNRSFDEALNFEMEWYDERFCPEAAQTSIDLYIPILTKG